MVALMAGTGSSGGALRRPGAWRLLAVVTAAAIAGYMLGRKSPRTGPEDGAERAASTQLW
jgi:hypothetical protein